MLSLQRNMSTHIFLKENKKKYTYLAWTQRKQQQQAKPNILHD